MPCRLRVELRPHLLTAGRCIGQGYARLNLALPGYDGSSGRTSGQPWLAVHCRRLPSDLGIPLLQPRHPRGNGLPGFAALWPVSLLGQFIDRLTVGDPDDIIWLLIGASLFYPAVVR